MQDFIFENRTKILFGRGTENRVGEETARFSRRVLLHHSGGHVVSSGLLDLVKGRLKEAGVEWVELSGVKPNPRLSLVRQGIELCRKEKIDFILAVGGGSVIDSAKGIAVGLPYAGDVWDFYDGKKIAQTALPVATILTIPATGSEASMSSVLTDELGPWKRGLNAECLRPVFSILDPELTFSLPPYQTACGIADMLAHIMERYFTAVPHVELTDRLCEAAMKTIVRNARPVMEDGDDYDARAELMWAATLAHNDLLGTGRIGDWASHRIEHEISALYDIAHGAGLAVVFPAWIEYNLAEDVARFARFASEVWGVDGASYDPEQAAREGIVRLRAFYRAIGLPASFEEADIPTDRVSEMAERAVVKGPLGSFRKLGASDVEAILRIASRPRV
jgi:alcohol dehydrogenase YqhD (iron-dependent ADH family)